MKHVYVVITLALLSPFIGIVFLYFYCITCSLTLYLFVPLLFFFPLTSSNLLDLVQLPLGNHRICSFSQIIYDLGQLPLAYHICCSF